MRPLAYVRWSNLAVALVVIGLVVSLNGFAVAILFLAGGGVLYIWSIRRLGEAISHIHIQVQADISNAQAVKARQQQNERRDR